MVMIAKFKLLLGVLSDKLADFPCFNKFLNLLTLY